MTFAATLTSRVLAAERAIDRRLNAFLRQRRGWVPVVLPYVSYGTTERVHVRARVLLRRRHDEAPRPRPALLTGLGHFLSTEVPDTEVTIDINGQALRSTSDAEGYVESTFELPLAPGWHVVTFVLPGKPRSRAEGRLLVVDPDARLGVVSDIDDTIIHTGLTRLKDAIRTTLFVPELARKEVAGAAELYRGLIAGADGGAQVFYVSTGAWNLHAMLERFLVRLGFPEGPLLMTDWGPSTKWLFREASVDFKTRVIIELLAEHPHLTWVLFGDSGQDDPEAYAAVARAHPERLHAVYIHDVRPTSPARSSRVQHLTTELAGRGVTMLLLPDSSAAADHAHSLGLIDDEGLTRVRDAVDAARR